MKKMLLLGMSLLLILGILAGCSNNSSSDKGSKDNKKASSEDHFKKEGYPVVDKKITLSMFGHRFPVQAKWENMDFFKEMEKKTNIHFKFDTTQAMGNDYEQKRALVFASGPIPDVFFSAMLTNRQVVENGANGTLIPLEDLIDKYAPHIKKAIDENEGVRKSITAPDGHIYTLPQLSTRLRTKFEGWWFNKKWLDELDMDKEDLPETTDELYDLLKTFKDKHPDGIPLSSNRIEDFGNSPIGAAFGYVPSGDSLMLKDDEVVYAPATKEYKAFLEYMHKLYNEKLLSGDIFTDDVQKYNARGGQNKIGLGHAAAPNVLYQFIGADEEDVDYSITEKYPLLPAMTSPIKDEKTAPKELGLGQNAFAITNKNEHPKATIRWIDYLFTKDGAQLAQVGVKGKDWVWSDDHTRFDMMAKAPEGKSRAQYRASVVPTGLNIPYYQKQEWVKYEGRQNPHMQKMYEEAYESHAVDIFPSVYLKEDEEKKTNQIDSDMDDYREQMEAKFITGEKSLDKDWDKYIKTLNSMDMDKYVEVYQKAYDRWKES